MYYSSRRIPAKLKGAHHLTNTPTTTTTLANTYYIIGGTWGDGAANNQFVLDGLGKLTYQGDSGVDFLFNGVSDLEVSAACKLHYALYLNGVLITGAETPHDFAASSKTESISITQLVTLQKNDEIEIYVKTDNAGTVVTHYTLFLTFWGER